MPTPSPIMTNDAFMQVLCTFVNKIIIWYGLLLGIIQAKTFRFTLHVHQHFWYLCIQLTLLTFSWFEGYCDWYTTWPNENRENVNGHSPNHTLRCICNIRENENERNLTVHHSCILLNDKDVDFALHQHTQ